MKFCVLSSGSKGNSTYIEINNHKFLIDVGRNFLYLSTKLKEIDVDIKDIEGIFITHNHQDHIQGLKVFINKVNPTIYLSKKIYDEIDIDINNYVFIEDDYNIDDINIKTIKLSHDTPECKGYIFINNDKDLVYITDTGYINKNYFDVLKNRCAYILESNHDVEMLMNCSRPYPLKMRVLGDSGHISNKDCLYYLTNFIGDKTKYVILAHISQDNNDPVLAYNNINDNLDKENLLVAKQEDRLEVIEL